VHASWAFPKHTPSTHELTRCSSCLTEIMTPGKPDGDESDDGREDNSSQLPAAAMPAAKAQHRASFPAASPPVSPIAARLHSAPALVALPSSPFRWGPRERPAAPAPPAAPPQPLSVDELPNRPAQISVGNRQDATLGGGGAMRWQRGNPLSPRLLSPRIEAIR